VKNFIYKKQNTIFILLISFFSIFINIYYGYRGVFPIDSFLIFDSGYNVLNGSHPFKDYWSITGPLLDYLQAIFFFIFGINWFSYVLHASVINLILALFSYFVFKEIGLKKSYSFLYSAGIALLAYPSIGVPFIDHHSTIFSILAIYCFILTKKCKKNFLFFLIPIFLGLAFFSKQIPSAYIITIITTVLFFENLYNFNKNRFFYLFLGATFFLLFVLLIFTINHIPFNNFVLQYILYPFSIGSDRFINLNLNFNIIFLQFKFIYFCLLPLLIIFIKISLKKQKTKEEYDDLKIIFLIIGMVLIFISTQIITQNQILIFFLIPMITGFSHIYCNKYFNIKNLIYILILFCLFSVFKYHLRFNEEKKFMELSNANIALAVNANQIDKIFSGLKWITTYYPNEPQKEVDNLIEIKKYLQNDVSSKIIISDYQFFLALTKAKLSSPNKWYDSMSIPSLKNKYYPHYKKFFVKKIKENNVEKIYNIGPKRYLPVLYSYFQDMINNNNCITSKEINEMLIVYDIKNCNL